MRRSRRRWRRRIRRRGFCWRRIDLNQLQQRPQTLRPQIALERRIGRPRRLRVRRRLLLLRPQLCLLAAVFRLGPGHQLRQGLWVVDFEVLAALRVLARRRRALLVRLVDGHVLVEDVERLLGGGELDGQDAFAVIHGLGRALAQLRALPVRRAVLVQQRVVAVVREAEAVVLAAVPAVVEAVPVAVDALDRVHTALCNGALLAHLLLGVGGWLQRLHDAQADLVGLDRLRVVGQAQGVRGAAIVRSQATGGLVARRGMRVVRVLLLVLRKAGLLGGQLGELGRVVAGTGGGRHHEAGAYPERQLGLGVLGLVGRRVEVLVQ